MPSRRNRLSGSPTQVVGAWAAVVLVAISGGLLMSSKSDAQSGQLIRPLVSFTCTAEIRLCWEVVKVLEERAPRHVYRVNPDPKPSGSFDLILMVDADGSAHLQWTGGEGQKATRNGHNDAEFARHIVSQASPALVKALNDT